MKWRTVGGATLGLLVQTACAGSPTVAPPAPAREAKMTICTALKAPFAPFELVVVGSGGPRGFGRAAAGYLVVVEGKPRALVDVGPGAFVRLGELDVDFSALDTVLLTHLHIDHAGDLPGFVKSRDLSADGQGPMAFRIFGPRGDGALFPSTTVFVDRLFGESGAFAYLRSFRHQLDFQVTDLSTGGELEGPAEEVLRDADLHITAIPVDHDDVPALAYRIEHGGHAVVISGDLASKNDNLARLAAGADLLVYDTAVVDPPGSPKPLYDLHTAPHRIGEIAAKAKVGSVLLSHLPPNVIKDQAAVLASVHASFAGPTQLAADCLRVRVGS